MVMASEDGLSWPLCVPMAKLGFAPRKRLTQSCGLSRCKSDSSRQRLLPAIAMALAGTAKSLERTIGGLPVFMHAPWRSFAGTDVARIPSALGLSMLLALPALAATDGEELTLEQLLETTVTSASKYEQKESEVAAAVTVITREQIRAYGWRTLAAALASLPGFFLTYDRQYTYVGARGFGLPGDYNTRIMLAINGNRVNDTVYDQAMLGREFPLDMDLVERIEVLAGPGGAIYGQNAMLGVVNVITRTGATVDGGEFAAAWQSPQAMREGRVSWGKVLDNGVDVLFSGTGMYARGENLHVTFPGAGPGGSTVSGVATGQDSDRNMQFFAHVGRGPWAFDFIAADRKKDDPYASFFTDPLTPGQYGHDGYLLTQLKYQDDFAGGDVNVMGRLFLGQYRYRMNAIYLGIPNRATANSGWYGGELRLLYSGLTDHKLMLGLEVQDNVRNEQANDDMSIPGKETLVKTTGYRVGLYAQDEWRIANAWSTTIGFRVDYNDITGSRISPRLGLIWRASPATTVKALYGQAHRAPNSYERDFDDGISQVANRQLAGETITTGELVVDHRLADDLTVRGQFYRWDLRDVVTLGIDSVSGLSQYRSGADVRVNGAEMSAAKMWASGARMRGSVAYQDASYVGGGTPANSPVWLGKFGFYTPLPWWGLQLGCELQYDSKRQAVDGTSVDGYWLANVNLIATRLAKGLDVSLAIHNLFNQHYQHPAADTNWQTRLDLDGINARIKLDYRF